MKKLIGIFVCMLLIGTVLPVSGNVEVESRILPLSSGSVLYVGGSGPGNYSTIQEAIDDAVDGDTVFVYAESSPYYEIIFISENKSIKLMGEDKDTTVIDANNLKQHVVEIRADGVEFSGFTVQNSGHFAGIMVTSSKNFIHDCNIYCNIRGIQLQAGIWNEKPYPRDNVISNNRFENNSKIGLIVYGNVNCSIIGNIAINTRHGIHVVDGSHNLIKDNIVKDNVDGLGISGSYNKISNNLLQNNSWRGIDVIGGNINVITQNNFIDNGPHGYEHANFYMCWWQYWRDNYWSPRRFQPSDSSKPVMINSVGPIFEFPPKLNFDWRPATEPHNI